MQGLSEYENSAYKENIAAIAGNNITQQSFKGDEYVENIINDKTGHRGKKSIENSFMFNEFGRDAEWGRNNWDDENKQLVTWVRNKETGDWEEKKFSYEHIASTVASNDTVKNTEEKNIQMAKQINSFENEDQADIFTAAVTKNTGFLSPELLKKSEKELKNIVETMEITDDFIKGMGDDAKRFGKTVDDQKKGFKAYQKEIVTSAKAFSTLKEDASGALGAIKSEAIENADAIKQGNYEWSEETIKHAKTASAALSAALGSEADLGLSPDFLVANQALIDDFINGVEGAGTRLQQALYDDAINSLHIPENAINQVKSAHQTLVDSLSDSDIQIGVDIDNTEFINKCQNIIDSAEMTQEQAEQYFGKLGFDVKGHTKTVPIKGDTVTYKWMEYKDPNDPQAGLEEKTETLTTQEGTREVFSLETITPNASFGGGIDKISSGANVYDSNQKQDTGNGGGNKGKTKPTKIKPTKPKEKDDEVERYHEINQELEDLQNILDDITNLKDEAWGADKLAAMDKEKKKLQEITASHKKYQAEIDLIEKIKANPSQYVKSNTNN